jgi:hypothetical protein
MDLGRVKPKFGERMENLPTLPGINFTLAAINSNRDLQSQITYPVVY